MIQYTVRVNTTLSLPSIPAGMPEVPPTACTIPAVPGGPTSRTLTFNSSALNRLNKRSGWLNDDCMDFCSVTLQRHLGTATSRVDPAIFSVFTFSQYLGGYDEALWRASLWAPKFWMKKLWMIPINRELSHWTLAIVYWKKKRIAYFDSFGSRSAWEMDAPVRHIIY